MFAGPPTDDEAALSIQWGPEELPKDLVEDLEANQHLFPAYVEAVKKSVLGSLQDPETKPRILSASLLKQRLREVHKAIVALRQDKGLSLRRIFDVLPGHYLSALKRGLRTEDVVEQHEVEATAWSRKRQEEVPLSSIIKDPRVIEKEAKDPKRPIDLSAAAAGLPDPAEIDKRELPPEWDGEIIPDETDDEG